MFLTVLYQMLALAIIILTGAWLYKSKRIDDATTSKLSALITHIFNPMLMLSSALSSQGTVDKNIWLLVMGIVMIIFFILFLLSFLVIPFFERKKGQKQLFQLMFIFGNLGFMGIPVVKGVYGAEFTAYVLPFMIGWNIYFYTFGLLLLNGKMDRKALLGMINPGSVGCLISIVLILFNPPLPSFISASVTYLGDLCSPLAMLIVGVSAAKSDLKRIFTTPKMYLFTLLRMVLIPILAIPCLHALPLDSVIQGICLIEISMPVGNVVLAIGMEKGFDTTDCSASIIMTTLLSVITLPIIVSFL